MLIIFLGIFSQWLAWLFRLPAIVLMAIAGLIAGPLLGIISPEESFGELFRPFISLAVGIILFEGSLNLNFREIRGFNRPVIRLVTVGAFVTWVAGSLAAHYIAGLSLPVAFVIGGLFIVTGPTVIMPLLRQAKLKPRPAALLKWEGIIVDPFGALLALFAYHSLLFIEGEVTAGSFGLFFLASLFAALVGAGAGWILGQMFERGKVPEYLKAPVVFAVVLFTFALSDAIMHETGLLAVTAMGVIMANMNISSIGDMRHFKENISVLLIASVFIMLTASLSVDVLISIFDWGIIAFVLVVLFVVRPLAVGIATIGTDLTWKERVLVGWIAPRGIVALTVSGYFASVLLEAGYPDAEILTALTLALVFSTVVAHGFSIGWVARKLDLAFSDEPGVLFVGANLFTTKLAVLLKEMNKRVLIMDRSWGRLQAARQAGVPTYAGEVLSEHTEYDIDITPFPTLVAATEIDSYNALVVNNFVPDFGRENLYQTAIHQADPKDFRATMSVRVLFGNEWNVHKLEEKITEGYEIRKTTITAQYTYEDFLENWHEGTILLLIIRASGAIAFYIADQHTEPQPGDTLISLAPPAQKEQRIQERLQSSRVKNGTQS
ncbi:cation:proton antiporter [Planococcus lenghuensis]|uniref:Sodium:proton exchanger n=1 Tax=Planococcus lenghuensis TaxID=2213202 RepID=A0A1Q2L1R9_9BACL|nr:sodium:proton antiporter [Planococcus lenghuensis]AQQ54356.1 sodium:proton exchanger [Planococcus lenghuensis]